MAAAAETSPLLNAPGTQPVHASPAKERPRDEKLRWELSAALGFPNALSARLARRFSRLRIGAEVGTLVFISSAGVSADVRLVQGRTFSFDIGARAVGIAVFAPSGGGATNYGAGPTTTVEMKLITGAFLAAEGGVLFGDWSGATDSSERWIPQGAVRVGWPF